MKIHIVFNKETWYSRLLSIIFLFGVFPYIVFIIGQRYQEYVELVSGASYKSIGLYNSDYTESYKPSNAHLLALEGNIEGKWRSVDNNKYVVIFRDLNRYFEYYDGSMANSGAWFIKQSLENTRFATSSKGFFLFERLIKGKSEKDTNGAELYDDDFIYQIQLSTDKNNLTLKYLDSGKEMNFVREYYSPGELEKVN